MAASWSSLVQAVATSLAIRPFLFRQGLFLWYNTINMNIAEMKKQLPKDFKFPHSFPVLEISEETMKRIENDRHQTSVAKEIDKLDRMLLHAGVQPSAYTVVG